MALFLQYFSTFISGFVVAFTVSWKMALVVACMLPIITTMAFLSAKVLASVKGSLMAEFHLFLWFRSSVHLL